ncbi:MAG: hypothetical protein CFH01_00523 [Alphaproteobacteria bacterium MarineAlpha2_Bin1]|nr:MAG: hypothetical protein CFH01_00523 [Alphaproteobacteria bacterium MarineAlpha2_Bin1]
MAEVFRNFVNIDVGQVHYRYIGEISNGELPLVLLHASPTSSISLTQLMLELSKYNHVTPLYAPDTLGNGDSCKPNIKNPDIEYYSSMLKKQLIKLNIDQINIYGTHTGGSIAMDFAINNPKYVKNIIIDGIGMYDEDEKADMLKNYTPEIKPDLMGTQINWAWHFIRDQNFFFPWYKKNKDNQRLDGFQSADKLHDSVVEVLKSIDTYHLAYRAAFKYPKREQLQKIKQPLLLIYDENDPLNKYKDEAQKFSPNAENCLISSDSSLAIKAKKIVNWLNNHSE